ncbi:hypothetical protein [Butyrivibrio sp. JL13D10]|uniref:hypothetical protein n=1 Tax=Butyrivibrio sp. JL13D10 TaxID=3236815 RepID=UPI0038B59926
MKVQKRGFFNFVFAFMPGASEMYMGFMKMGISLMACFMGAIGIIGFLGLSDLFMLIPVVLWFYSFFHARNIATCRPEIFAGLQDDYFWNEIIDGKKIIIKSESARKIGAWALIIAGVSIIWNMVIRNVMDGLTALAEITGMNYMYDTVADFIYSLPRLLVAVIIIIVGVKLIRGKKKTLYIEEQNPGYMTTAPSTQSTANTVAASTPAPFKAADNTREEGEKNA